MGREAAIVSEKQASQGQRQKVATNEGGEEEEEEILAVFLFYAN